MGNKDRQTDLHFRVNIHAGLKQKGLHNG